MRFVDGQSDLHTGGAMPIAGRPLDPASVFGAILVTRANGIAPMGVVFQAGQSGFVSTRPAHELRYKWRFPAQDDYSAPAADHPWGRARSVAYGPAAAFVFKEPGSHVVTLEVTDGVQTAIETFTIEVADPDLLFAGPQTYVISAGASVDVPPGAILLPSLAAARADVSGTGRRNARFLFARGQTHDISAGAGVFASGDFDNLHFGSIGYGAIPHLTGGGLRTEGDPFFGSVAVSDLWIEGDFDPVTGAGFGSAGDGLDLRGAATHCVTDCFVQGFATCVRTEAGLGDVVLSNTTVTGWSQEGVVFDDGDRVALVGCAVVPMDGTNPAYVAGGPGRMEGAAPGKAVIWQSDLHSINSAPCWRWNADGAPSASGIIGASRLEGGSPVLELAPSNPGGLDRAGDLIVERCYLLGGAETGAAGAVKLTFGGTTLRNCVAVLPDVAPASGVDAPAFVTGPAPQTNAANDISPVRIHNNSFIDLRSPATLAIASTAFAEVEASHFAHWMDAEIVNQIAHAPSLQSPLTSHAPFDETPIFTPREQGITASAAVLWAPFAKEDDTDSAQPGTVALDDFMGRFRPVVAERGAHEIPGVLTLHEGGMGGVLAQGVQSGVAGFDITEPLAFSGAFTLDVDAIRAGPVALRPPAISGTLSEGNTLVASPGVVAWDPALGRPLVLYQWLRGSEVLDGATDLTRVVDADDVSIGVSLQETVYNAGTIPLVQNAVVSAVSYTPSAALFVGSTRLSASHPMGGSSEDRILIFCSVEFLGGYSRICDTDNGGMQIILTGSAIQVRLRMSDGSTETLSTSVSLGPDVATSFLVAAEHSTGRRQIYVRLDDGPWTMLMNTNAPFAGTSFDMSSAPLNFYRWAWFKNYRTAIFLPATLPDISAASVRDRFVQQSGEIADPQLSQAAYGVAQVDIYGEAATLQTGAHFGSLPAFTVTGSITDV